MSLDALIRPYDRKVFFREFWERDALHIARNDPAYFSTLLEDLPLEQVIWQTCHNWGDVSLARSNTSYESAPYAALPPDVSTVSRAFADGYTVVINNLERKSLRVAQFCRDVEKDWYFNTIVNLYYTGANSQGLNYHYDTEDVFILQLEGRKEWRIYESGAELPLDDGSYEQPDCDQSPFDVYDVGPGDVLYIPRGVVHEARTRDSASLHLTLTVSVVRWASLLQRLVQAAARDDVELRRGVPLDLLNGSDVSTARAAVGTLLGRVCDEKHLEAAVSEIQDGLLIEKRRLPMNGALDGGTLNEIGLGSVVGVAPDQVYMIGRSAGGGLTLKFIGASVELAEDLEETVRFICERETFLVHELPGELTLEEKLTLVKRLAHCEFLSARS